MLGLYNRRAAAQQSNLVIDWLLVATSGNMKFCKVFVDFSAYFVCFILPGNAETDVR